MFCIINIIFVFAPYYAYNTFSIDSLLQFVKFVSKKFVLGSAWLGAISPRFFFFWF